MTSYYGFVGTLAVALISGYTVFLPGGWDVPSFFFSYFMIGILPVLFIFWKLVHKTQVRLRSSFIIIRLLILPFKSLQWRNPEDVTFFEEERKEVDRYESRSSSTI